MAMTARTPSITSLIRKYNTALGKFQTANIQVVQAGHALLQSLEEATGAAGASSNGIRRTATNSAPKTPAKV